MGMIGNAISSVSFTTDLFSGTGSAVAFVLSRAPAATASIAVHISGVYQSPTTYTLSGTTMTFASAPASGTDNIAVLHLGTGYTAAVPSDGSVTTVKIADSNVTTAKIADSQVTTAKIADSQVTTAKIADSQVTTAKIADSAVTNVKITSMANTKITGVITNAQLANTTGSGAVVLTTSPTLTTPILGIPTSGTLTNCTGLPLAGLLGHSTSGNVLTSNGSGWASSALFVSGTALVFAQTAAPTGWTKSTTHNDKALRVVSGSASSGGSVAFTTAFASQAVAGTNASGAVSAHTLTTAEMPSHAHDYTNVYAGGGLGLTTTHGYPFYGGSSGTSSTGGGGSHTHSFTQPTFSGTAINLAVSYVDVIIATKD